MNQRHENELREYRRYTLGSGLDILFRFQKPKKLLLRCENGYFKRLAGDGQPTKGCVLYAANYYLTKFGLNLQSLYREVYPRASQSELDDMESHTLARKWAQHCEIPVPWMTKATRGLLYDLHSYEMPSLAQAIIMAITREAIQNCGDRGPTASEMRQLFGSTSIQPIVR